MKTAIIMVMACLVLGLPFASAADFYNPGLVSGYVSNSDGSPASAGINVAITVERTDGTTESSIDAKGK